LDTDSNGNAVVGKQVKMVDSNNCLVHFPENKKALIQGLSDCIVVEADGQLMIIRMSDEQKIKEYMKLFQ
jgi:mannose-1-phosphate guanylyltransferase